MGGLVARIPLVVWGSLKARMPHGCNVIAGRQPSVGETAITKSVDHKSAGRESCPGLPDVSFRAK